LEEQIVCYNCGEVLKPFDEWRCSRCGGPGVVAYGREFMVSKIRQNEKNMWRYREFLPPSMRKTPVTLGEGYTPLVQAPTPNIYFKLEYLNPTGSFKDRGTAAMMTSLRNILGNVQGVCEDSSGNAGASVAAYCAFLGLNCVIFGGGSMVSEKVLQVRMYGADLRLVDGPRQKVEEEAVKHAEKNGLIYVGHTWNPYFIEGMKTVAYEVAEQTGWNPPDIIYLPVSAGTLLIGLYKGFRDMVEAGVIEKIPQIVAVQPQLNAPLYAAYKKQNPAPYLVGGSIADALTQTNPPRLRQMVDMLEVFGGDVEVVSDEDIIKAHKQLAWAGFYAELSSAAAYAAVRKRLDEIVSSPQRVLVILTGLGHKSMEQMKLVQ
jgi:threonine synthase